MFLVLSFSIGVMLVGFLPVLPSALSSFVFLFLSCLLVYRYRFSFAIHHFFACILGVSYGVAFGQWALAHQLAPQFAEKNLVIEGRVVGLPSQDSHRQIFNFSIERASFMGREASSILPFPRNISLSSYGNLRVAPGERWRLSVKLKVPRGFVNPHGFDYQVSLLRKGIGATGSVREGTQILLADAPALSLDVVRFKLQQWVAIASPQSARGILTALLVGDTSFVSQAEWRTLTQTGTNHLIAISGLHLGFFAIVGFALGKFIGRFFQLIIFRCPASLVGHVCAFCFTFFYSLIAGFNIPTIRTLIMLTVVQLMFCFKRNIPVRKTLALALCGVLVYDPLAAYDIGFWLSFCAVSVLLVGFSGRISTVGQSTLFFLPWHALRNYVRSQWIIFIGLFIPLSFFIHSTSLTAPFANFVAIPTITFFVVPCLLLAALMQCVGLELAQSVLNCAAWGVDLVDTWLQFLLRIADGKLNPLINLPVGSLLLAVISVCLILIPSGVVRRSFGVAGLLFAFALPGKKNPALQILVFDVGQGTSVLIRTQKHQLLYDTGPQYTDNFNAGSGIIVPYLWGQGINHIDTLVVSHNDKDHIGGLTGVLSGIRVENLLLGESEEYLPANPMQAPLNCHSQPAWRWDDVVFRFLNWPIDAHASDNNRSCVLLIEYQSQKILLTGDIEKEVERALLASQNLSKVTILLAPHHGSHSSSTAEFVSVTNPEWVIYSAGYRNQHGHPHADIISRYQTQGAQALNTANSGAIEFLWGAEGFTINTYRLTDKHYWYDATQNTFSLHKN